MPKQELALRSSTDLKKVDTIKQILRGEIPAENLEKIEVDPEAAQKQMFEQILSAQNDAEMENSGGATPWQKLAGVPVEILGFDAAISDRKEGAGPPIFAVVDIVRLDTGDHLTVTNGSWNVWAALINLAERNQIPGAVKILHIGEETRSGGRPQRLISPESK
jgi:hypothetical protein